MAGLVGGALLSAAFNVLLERLTPEQDNLLNFIRGKKLDSKLLHRLKPSLIAAKAVLNDAELKQFTDPAVKDWLDELRDAVYDLEDLMDEISTKAATQNQVCDFSSASPNLRDTDIANKLEAITDTIEFIVRQKDALDLKKSSGIETLSWRPQVTSRVKVSDVCGRKKEKEDIIKLLFDDDGDDDLSVIPIVGMGGVGKTTLVQLVYNDDNVKRKFDLRAWVCISEAFELLKITQTLVKSISPNFVGDMMDSNLLQLYLAEKLIGKKFLIVLDDLWNEKYIHWDTLKNLFCNGVEGCKILVTTRLERVALMVKTIKSFYRLDLLSDKDCLSIFARHAFHSSDTTVNSFLEKNGEDVTSKCKGLPLAAKVLGGLFRSEPHIEFWNTILKDNIWYSAHNEIIPALRVSYSYLPPHLKQCFIYCSLFPEDYQFDKEELILLWMAEGFLQSPKGNMTLEEVGYGYFDDLASRSFFQPSSEDNGYFVMHDLIRELATCIAGDFYLRLEKDGNKIGNKTRHVSVNFLSYLCLENDSFSKAKALRSFMGLKLFNIPRSIGNSPYVLLSNLKYLRVLSLDNLSALKIIPNSVGEFIHLRYLDLSGTQIASLPNSLCKLHNLQTLKLAYCYSLEMLPSDMQDLVNLRYLNLTGTKIVSLPDSLRKLYNLQTLKLRYCSSLNMLSCDVQDLVNLRRLDVRDTPLEQMPRGLSKLKDLQFLSSFIVGKGQGNMIGELGEISNLKDKIVISRLENIKNGYEACEARMMEKKHIEDLRLTWSSDDYMEDSQTERDILDKLQPHWDLQRLRIDGYRGTLFPSWLGSRSYHNMTSLMLLNCQNCCMLPSLGQLPTLKYLTIEGFDSVVSIGIELLKGGGFASMIPFASLEELRFSEMIAWEEWHSIDMEAFPRLRELKIVGCPRLVGNLPCQLLSVETLRIENCPLFASCIPRCPKLQKLDVAKSQNVALQEQELPLSLGTLSISGSQMLEWLLEAHSENLCIEFLRIYECSKLSIPMVHLPSSLKHLHLYDCENVNFVSISTTTLQNLQSIRIDRCKYLKFLWDDMEGLLPNLKKLDIWNCEAFPEGILSSSVRELRIDNCEKLLSHHAERHLPSITYLDIWGSDDSCIKCFPEEGCSLPATLTTLELHHLPSLETLNCTALQHLTSLQQLTIMYCRKLEKMSGSEKLPNSLKKLHIWECPLLAERCHKRDPQIWPKISHIPFIHLFGC